MTASEHPLPHVARISLGHGGDYMVKVECPHSDADAPEAAPCRAGGRCWVQFEADEIGFMEIIEFATGPEWTMREVQFPLLCDWREEGHGEDHEYWIIPWEDTPQADKEA